MTSFVHSFDPIAFSIDGFPVSWYWLNYVFSFLLISFFLLNLQKSLNPQLSRNDVLDHLVASWFGLLIGGRLGYVLLYNPEPFFAEPSLIYQFWLGGMAFHGALVGYVLANLLTARIKGIGLLTFMDLASLGVPIGLFTGRLLNFINGELWGRVSDVPWAIAFPLAGPEPRHPSQIYEAFGEGLLLFGLMWSHRRRIHKPGQLSALFLIYYGLIRFGLEFFREPDSQIGYVLGPLSMGQILSILTALFGALVFYLVTRPTEHRSSKSSSP